jgi:AhpD family alkylhydroperoxidase
MGPAAIVDHRLREIVYPAVSSVNESGYCASHHVKAALAAGVSSSECREIESENNQHFSPKEQAALNARTASVGDDTRYRAQRPFSTDEFVELTMIVGIANLTDRFNNGLAVPPEE